MTTRSRWIPKRRLAAIKSGWKFFRQWVRSPREMSSVSPSSRELAQKLAAELLKSTRRVIELGGGTGAVTRELLACGIEPHDLLVLELNQTLYIHLQQAFPGVHVECADALDLERIAIESGWIDGAKADAVVCGLGLLSMVPEMQQRLLEAAFAAMSPKGRFILFTYGPTNPVVREVMQDLNLGSRRGRFTLKNIPPATIHVLTRNRSRRVKPQTRPAKQPQAKIVR